MLPDGIPERTLGWQVLQWCSQWLVNPDSYGGVKGEQWVFKPDQAHFILWFYAVDENGDWVYRRAYRERAKGTGKSPMVAAIACAEFLGPTEFSYFDENGNAIGKVHDDPVVWLAAVSLDGSDHTYKYVMGMLEGKAEYHFGLDIGMTRILQDGHKANKLIKQVTASPKSLEGPKPTFVICEETQNWTPAEQGPQLMAVIHRGLFKTNGRRIEVTNAPVPGQNTVAEETHKAWQAILEGEDDDPGILFDTFSIHVDDIYDIEQAMPALEVMYKDAPWIKLNRAWKDINDRSHSEIDSRRFFFNEIVPPNAMWISEAQWDSAERPGLKLKKTDKIALGVRVRKDCAAIVATRLKDLAVFSLKVWERPDSVDTPHNWVVPYGDIDAYFKKLVKTHNVVYVLTSPNGFQDIVISWQAKYEDELMFEELWLDKSKQKHVDAVDLFEKAVFDNRLIHDGNDTLRRHVMNCFVTELPQGSQIRMDTLYSKRYIVAAEAALLSLQGAQEAILEGLLNDEADNWVFSF